MATRRDPSSTTTLSRAFAREIVSRFNALAVEVKKTIETDDALGLDKPHKFQINVDKRAWAFHTNDKKVEQFNKWLKLKVDEKVLSTDATGKPWTGKYIESAYKKGALRAYVDAQGKKMTKSMDFFAGSKEQFLKSAFSQPERLSKARLLATRSFEELKGIGNQTATKLNRILSNGLIQGHNPKKIATEMVKEIRGMSKARATVIARTEIVHAHAEGQLDSFEDLGTEKVGVYAEYSTAGDEKVCEECSDLEGTQYTIEEARGVIPQHPNCRCAWIPGEEVSKRGRIKRMIKESNDKKKAAKEVEELDEGDED